MQKFFCTKKFRSRNLSFLLSDIPYHLAIFVKLFFFESFYSHHNLSMLKNAKEVQFQYIVWRLFFSKNKF